MTDGSSRLIAIVLAVFGLFGGCRDFGGDTQDGARGGNGGTSGEQGGTGDTSGAGGSDTGGTGGTEVNGGSGGDAGGGQGGSEGGSGGAGGSNAGGGAAGDGGIGGDKSECWLDQTVVPECFSYPPNTQGGPPGITFRLAGAVTITATEAFDGRFRIIATQQGSSTLGTIYTVEPNHRGWFSWHCFDAVPYPQRLAATTLVTDAQEVFAITGCGHVYVRRYLFVSGTPGGWSPWVPLELPSSSSLVTDASIARLDGANDLFVVDRGSVFAARKTEALGPYGPWRRVATGAGDLLAAGVHANVEDQRLFTLDDNGQLLTSSRPSDDPEAPFGEWTDFGSDHVFVDFDAPYGVGGQLIVVALDSDGKVWTREEEDAAEFGEWVQLDAQGEPTDTLVSIAGASFPARAGQPLMLVAAGTSGTVYSVRRTDSGWEPWWNVSRSEPN
jgi:hypothetical protein